MPGIVTMFNGALYTDPGVGLMQALAEARRLATPGKGGRVILIHQEVRIEVAADSDLELLERDFSVHNTADTHLPVVGAHPRKHLTEEDLALDAQLRAAYARLMELRVQSRERFGLAD